MNERVESGAPVVEVDDVASQIVDLVRLRPGLSRTEVSAATGLSKTVVNQRVQDLLANGVFTEAGELPSSGGRRAQRLRLAAEKGYVLAAELGMTHVRLAAADLEGRLLRVAEERVDGRGDPEAVLKEVAGLLEACALAVDDARLCGVGMGLPAPVEFSSGRPVAPPVNPSWHDFPVRDWLERRFAAPAWIDNEVNLMALAELRHGAAIGHDNALVIKIGAWVGAGLISNGQLHRGAQGCAGSLTSMAGAEGLIRQAAIVAAKHPDAPLSRAFRAGQPRVEDVVRLAEEGDQASAMVLREAAEDVGRTIAVCVDFFNPSLVVISGGLGGSGETFLAHVRKVVYGNALALATRDLQIRPSSLGPDAGVLGAARLALDGAFDADRLPDTVALLVAGAAPSTDTTDIA